MKRAAHAGLILVTGLGLALFACGAEQQPAGDPPPAEPTPSAEGDPKDPKAAEPTPAADAPKEDEAAKPAEPAEPAKADAPAEPAGADGAEPTAGGDGGEAKPVALDGASEPSPAQVSYPSKNTIVRDPEPDSPAGVIMRALEAAMNPDADKGWEQFEALLHTSEKLPNALISRRELNWPAMRRKVHLFLIEDPKKPIYQWAYAEETADGQLKIFVHNPKSMPTPCYVAQDPEQDNQWKIRTCSL